MANDIGSNLRRRSHYQERRAHAEGWEIEAPSASPNHWVKLRNPYFDSTSCAYRIIPDADGWLPWYGSEDGKGPFEGNPIVETLIGTVVRGALNERVDWSKDQIYRSFREVKTYQVTLNQLKVLSWIVCDLDAVKGVFKERVKEGHRIIEAILGDDCPLIYGEPE